MFSSGRFSIRFRNRTFFGLTALFSLPLGGCGYVTAVTSDHVAHKYNASTGMNTAVVANARSHVLEPECLIEQREDAYREVVVDAGPVLLRVECRRATGFFDSSTEQLGRATIAFHAETGGQYQVRFSDDFGFPHVAVTEAGDASAVIHRSMLGPQSAVEAGPANVTLVARSGMGIIPCKFGRPWADRRTNSVRRPAESFMDEPYSHQIFAECATYAYVTGYVKERYEAPVDFVPESGRLYTVHMDEEIPDVVFVTDVSSEVRTVAHVKATRTH